MCRRCASYVSNRVLPHGQPLICRKSPLEVIIFLARNEAEICERGKELLCFGGLAKYQIGFTKMLMRAAVINCFRLHAMARTETTRSRSHTANPECHG